MISDYFASLERQVQGITTCAALSTVSASRLAEIAQMQSNVISALALIAPLLTAPTNLSETLTWIASMVSQFALQNTTLLAQQSELATKLASYEAAVAARQSALGCI